MPKQPTQRPLIEAERKLNSSSDQSTSLSPSMQIDAFTDERMKILYTLSFMSGGMAQVWEANETSVTLANMSMFNTLKGLLMSIKKTFRDPDRERMACTQLHALKMTLGIMQRNTWPTLRCLPE